ncbi:hypothetical protein D1007_15406 [Hordeum vulgare]|nr:hypothetical protein D1007_15406 [Hordeum vulgare]
MDGAGKLCPRRHFSAIQKKAPNLYSYAVVDGSTICISSPEKAIGTYTFDTVNEKWSQAAHRALPFFGRADNSLWAASQGASYSTWDYLDLPEEEPWTPSQLHLFSLGSGKFCVATLFGTALRTCGICHPTVQIQIMKTRLAGSVLSSPDWR